MITKYSAIRHELRTGDIVLFSGKGPVSDVIKYATLSKWSHVGLILKLPEYNFLTVWESTTLSNVADLETGVPRKGVQLVPLSARVQAYSGDIVVRQLKGGILLDAKARLMALRRELRGKPYERSKLELLKAVYDGPLGENREDLSSIFCSELVAEAYQYLGLLPDKPPSNEYTPADFSEKRLWHLKKGFHLSHEITLKDE